MIYGLTGQTGAGKTTVSEELKEKGYFVIDCDLTARKVVEKGSPVLDELKTVFGENILNEKGELIRSTLAEKAFANEENRQKLNSITHPAITKAVINQIRNSFSQKYKGVIIDAAAIFDSELIRYCSRMIVVVAPEAERLDRIIKRDGIDVQAAMLRIKAQPDEKYYKERADILIRNYKPYTISDELSEL
ncbi:MAG: dephospho-CoA kinase [Clostridia bacterium]|nr:dephospho-CoA kinase [Clostridia bacterium]